MKTEINSTNIQDDNKSWITDFKLSKPPSTKAIPHNPQKTLKQSI